jgi:hypothetical protein
MKNFKLLIVLSIFASSFSSFACKQPTCRSINVCKTGCKRNCCTKKLVCSGGTCKSDKTVEVNEDISLQLLLKDKINLLDKIVTIKTKT